MSKPSIKISIFKDKNVEQKHGVKYKKAFAVLKDRFVNKENPLYPMKRATATALKQKSKLKKNGLIYKDKTTQTHFKYWGEELPKLNDEKGVKKITVQDVTGDMPSEFYWERLAKRRQQALEETLEENQRLKKDIEGLENEFELTLQQIEEAHHLSELLREIIYGPGNNHENDNDLIDIRALENRKKNDNQSFMKAIKSCTKAPIDDDYSDDDI